MRLRVGRDALGDAVAWVARALPSRPVVPVLSGLLLQATGDELTLSCFDYEVAARISVQAEVAEPGTALVPGRLLAEIVRSLPAFPAEFRSAPDMVSLTCGSAEFMLVSLPVEEYPALPAPAEPAGEVDGGALALAAARVTPSASRDDTLPMLTGVHLEVSGDVMTLAATDRYRLAVATVRWAPVTPELRAAALVPARTLAEAVRTMAAGAPVAISFGVSGAEPGGTGAAPGAGPGHETGPRPAEGMITFEGGGRRLTARLIAGEFIRYQSRFPADFGCRAELAAVPFIEAVRRVSLVAERASPVRLAFGPGEVVVEANAEGRARAVESVAADFAGDERLISFNPQYLLDGLVAAAAPAAARPPAQGTAGAAADADPVRIRLQFTSPAKPALITSAEPASAEPASAEPASAEPAGAEPAGAEPPGPDPAAQHAVRPAPGAAEGAGDSAGVPSFRYLVVPLRAPDRP